MRKTHHKSKLATDIRGECLIYDNAGVNKCKLIQEFTDLLETETVIQFLNVPK